MGLLTDFGVPATSRKQYDWYVDRVGPAVRQEQRVAYRYAYTLTSNGGPQDLPILAIPTDKRARLLRVYVLINANASVSYYDFRIDGAIWRRFDGAVDIEFEERYLYEDAPPAVSSYSLYVQQPSTPLVLDVQIILLYSLEPAGEGYFVTV